MSQNSGFQEYLCFMVPNTSRMKPKLLGGPSRFITPQVLFLPSLCTPIIQPGQAPSYPELPTSIPMQSFLLAFPLNSKFPKPSTSFFMKLSFPDPSTQKWCLQLRSNVDGKSLVRVTAARLPLPDVGRLAFLACDKVIEGPCGKLPTLCLDGDTWHHHSGPWNCHFILTVLFKPFWKPVPGLSLETGREIRLTLVYKEPTF